MPFEFKEPARLYEPPNGHEIKVLLKQTIDKVLEGDGNLRQNVTYPIFGVNIRLEYFTGGAGTFETKDWKSEGEQQWKVEGTDLSKIDPADLNRRIYTEEIRIDGINTPADLMREQTGQPIPVPVATATGYVQTTLDQMRPAPTRTAAEEIADLVASVEAEQVTKPGSPNSAVAAKPNKLSGTGVKKSMTPGERAEKMRLLQEE